jgi:hypothetical protein
MVLDCVEDDFSSRAEVLQLFNYSDVAWHGLVDFVRTRHAPTKYEARSMSELAVTVATIARTTRQDSPLLTGIVRRAAANGDVSLDAVLMHSPPAVAQAIDPFVVTLTLLGSGEKVAKAAAEDARRFCLRLRSESERHARKRMPQFQD